MPKFQFEVSHSSVINTVIEVEADTIFDAEQKIYIAYESGMLIHHFDMLADEVEEYIAVGDLYGTDEDGEDSLGSGCFKLKEA